MARKEWDEGYEEGFEQGFKSAQAFLKDDPEADCTDFAHPAWWRGVDYAHLQLVNGVNKILDGETVNAGTASQPWEALRQRLYDIRTLLGIADRIVHTVESSTLPRMCSTSILQWYKVRSEYIKRRQDAERS
jgi:hypothetical protein